jgi:hypothetical protein
MGSVPQVTFLLAAGADVTITNDRGLTPLQVRLSELTVLAFRVVAALSRVGSS